MLASPAASVLLLLPVAGGSLIGHAVNSCVDTKQTYAWIPLFFGLHMPGAAMAVIAALTGCVALLTAEYGCIDAAVAVSIAPYLCWIAFATYLTDGRRGRAQSVGHPRKAAWVGGD